jgi:hypothetical protein
VRNYPVVVDAIKMLAMPIVRAKFHWACADPRGVALAQRYIEPLLPRLMEDLVMGGFQFGFQVCEVVWAPALNVEIYPEDGEPFWMPAVWAPSTMIPYAPEEVQLMADQRSGKLTGARLLIPSVGKWGEQFLPIDKMLIWTHDPEFGSYYGVPRTRPIVPFVERANEIWDDLGRYYRRIGIPWTIGWFKSGFTDYGPDGEFPPTDNANEMINLIEGLQSGHSLVLPSDQHRDGGGRQWDIETRGEPAFATNFTEQIAFVHDVIRTGLCVPKLASSSEAEGGTYNLGQAQIAQHNENIMATLSAIEAAINQQLMKPFSRYNLGPKAPSIRLVFEPVSTDVQLVLLQGLISMLSQGVEITDREGNAMVADWAKIAEDNGLPVLKKDQRAELLDLFRRQVAERETMNEVESPPAVELAEWREEDHPRDQGGKFAKKDEESEGGGADSDQPVVPKNKNLKTPDKTASDPNDAFESSTADEVKDRFGVRIPVAEPYDVQINTNPNAKMVARYKYNVGGKEKSGIVYDAKWLSEQQVAKFERVQYQNEYSYEIKSALEAYAHDNDEAKCCLLMHTTGIRIGSDANAGEKHTGKTATFGASSLRTEHIHVEENGDVRLKFTGKKGVEQDVLVNHPTLAKWLAERSTEGPGKIFDTNEVAVRKFAQDKIGLGKAHDFRTMLAHRLAQDTIDSMGPPQTAKEFTQMRKQIGEAVAAQLGNNPSESLKSYIPPVVFADWAEKVNLNDEQRQKINLI